MNWLENVKKIKKEKRLTNEMLAEKSGISLGTLNKLLSGSTEDPKLSTLSALKNALGISFDEMLGEKSENEISSALAEKYAALDKAGRETADFIINKEYIRVNKEKSSRPYSLDNPKIRHIKLYSTSASAGVGNFLDESDSSEISVYSNPITEVADFAVKVRGESMMPKYHDGDILLIEQTESVHEGELGLFILNGESFFKKFGGDRLISLNPDYKDIIIMPYDDIRCFGRVLGKISK